MLQTVVVIIVFVVAVAYVGRLLFNALKKEDGCASGCGKCRAVDVNAIEKQLKQKGF